VDLDRGLRLELKSRDHEYDLYRFRWKENYVELVVQLLPPVPGSRDIVLDIMDGSLLEQSSRSPVQGAELERLRLLIPEAVEAFWRLGGGPFRNLDKVVVKSTF